MIGRRTAPILASAALLAGCVSTWTPRTTAPQITLQWPYPPRPAKVTFVRSLAGFTPSRSAGSALRAFAIGEGEREARGAFVLPVAVAVGADGRIAVADSGCRCAHLFLPATGRYLRLLGSKQEVMRSPVAVAFDDESRLFVSDSAGSVFAFGADGAFQFTLANAGATPLQRPTGLAFSPVTGRLYVVDTLAHAVYAFDRRRELVAAFGARGEGSGAFNFPTHLAWAPPGELYVTDALNFRVQILDEEGRPRGGFGRHGDGSGDIAMPKGLAVDGDGVVYLVDSLFDSVQLFDRKGDFLLTVGRRGTELGEFWLPSGAFLSASGELYVCDTYNRRIQVFRVTDRYAEPTS
jgi:sugar lactone lactonase YvrE